MADTPNDEAQPSASGTGATKKKVKKVAAKKTTTKKVTTKKASKKVVAKKGTAKKKSAAASTTPATTAPTTPTPAAPIPPVPQWDDDQGGIGMIGQLVQWGPVLLLILLILVLDSHDGDAQAGLEVGAVETKANEGAMPALSSEGAVTLSESFDPWVFGNASDLGSDSLQGLGSSEILPDTGWLEDPAAFYWGPAIVDEFPPAPETSESQ